MVTLFCPRLQNADVFGCRGERRPPDGARPPSAAPPLHLSLGLGGAERPPQTQLGPESLTENKVDERVQADI